MNTWAIVATLLCSVGVLLLPSVLLHFRYKRIHSLENSLRLLGERRTMMELPSSSDALAVSAVDAVDAVDAVVRIRGELMLAAIPPPSTSTPFFQQSQYLITGHAGIAPTLAGAPGSVFAQDDGAMPVMVSGSMTMKSAGSQWLEDSVWTRHRPPKQKKKLPPLPNLKPKRDINI